MCIVPTKCRARARDRSPEFLLRPGESREILGQWMSSNAIHENKKRRATQVITGSFPCRKWLHKLYSHISPFCELCRSIRVGPPTSSSSFFWVGVIKGGNCHRGQVYHFCWVYHFYLMFFVFSRSFVRVRLSLCLSIHKAAWNCSFLLPSFATLCLNF